MRQCHECAYAKSDPAQWIWNMLVPWPATVTCVNRYGAEGELSRVLPSGTCRNFRPRRRRPLRVEPPEPPNDEIRYIALTKGKFAVVDAADYEYLSGFRWHAKETRGRFYAATVIDGKSVTMHQLLMKPPAGYVVDHIDGNPLNNRRDNLRICTPQQNRRSTRPTGKSPYVGVSPAGKRCKAKIKHNGRSIFLGTFDDPTEAARARDRAARKYHGDFAWLNFPEEGG